MNNETKKHYLIYQITNLLNGKIYIGKHITENIEDEYFGSGKYLKHAIQKYGLENFEFKILMDLNNEEEMNLLEKCVVKEDFCNREDTYNIMEGGSGGWSYVNSDKSEYHPGSAARKNACKKAGKACQAKLKMLETSTTQIYLSHLSEIEQIEYKKKLSEFSKAWHKKHLGYFAGKHNPMYGRIHTDETKRKMSISQLGSKNSQYGTIAIYNEETFERATQPKDQPIPKGWAKGRFYSATPEELKERKQFVEEILKLDPNSIVTIRYKLDNLKHILNKIQNKKQKIKENIQCFLYKQQQMLEKTKLLTEQYEYYCQYGWDKFVEKYQYKYSKQNFTQQCKKHVKDFVSQNGKKRGSTLKTNKT